MKTKYTRTTHKLSMRPPVEGQVDRNKTFDAHKVDVGV